MDRHEHSILSADWLLFSYYCTIARSNYLIPINRHVFPSQAPWFRWFNQSRKRTRRFCDLFIRCQVTVFYYLYLRYSTHCDIIRRCSTHSIVLGVLSPITALYRHYPTIGTGVLVGIVSIVEFEGMSTSILGAGPSSDSTTFMFN